MNTIPDNLRLADIIAKTARVTLKDTMRVMQSILAVSHLYDTFADDIIGMTVYDTSRPIPENVAACEQSAFELREAGCSNDALADALSLIRSLV